MAITSQIVGLDPDDFGYSVSVKKIEVMDGEEITYQRVADITYYVVGVDADGNRIKQHREVKRLKDIPATPRQKIRDLAEIVWQLGQAWVNEQQSVPEFDN